MSPVVTASFRSISMSATRQSTPSGSSRSWSAGAARGTPRIARTTAAAGGSRRTGGVHLFGSGCLPGRDGRRGGLVEETPQRDAFDRAKAALVTASGGRRGRGGDGPPRGPLG